MPPLTVFAGVTESGFDLAELKGTFDGVGRFGKDAMAIFDDEVGYVGLCGAGIGETSVVLAVDVGKGFFEDVALQLQDGDVVDGELDDFGSIIVGAWGIVAQRAHIDKVELKRVGSKLQPIQFPVELVDSELLIIIEDVASGGTVEQMWKFFTSDGVTDAEFGVFSKLDEAAGCTIADARVDGGFWGNELKIAIDEIRIE